DQLADADLGDVARLSFFILILAILDLTLDEDLLALLAVALDDVGESTTLFRVPRDAVVPLGLFLLFAGSRGPLAAGGKREVRDAAAGRSGTDVWILTQVADQLHSIQAASHGISCISSQFKS